MEHIRITLTLERKVADELRRVAGLRGVSTFVNDTLKQQLQARRLRKLLDEMDREFGPIPVHVQQDVDALMWPDSSSTAAR